MFWSLLLQSWIFLHLRSLFTTFRFTLYFAGSVCWLLSCLHKCLLERSSPFFFLWVVSHCSCCLLVVSVATSPSFTSGFWSSPSKVGGKLNSYPFCWGGRGIGGGNFFLCLYSFSHCSNWIPYRWVRRITKMCASHSIPTHGFGDFFCNFLEKKILAIRYNLMYSKIKNDYSETHFYEQVK